MNKESKTEVSKKNWDRITGKKKSGKKKSRKKKVRGKSKSSEFINSSYLLH